MLALAAVPAIPQQPPPLCAEWRTRGAVQWTWWRRVVFFEAGVSLAVALNDALRLVVRRYSPNFFMMWKPRRNDRRQSRSVNDCSLHISICLISTMLRSNVQVIRCFRFNSQSIIFCILPFAHFLFLLLRMHQGMMGLPYTPAFWDFNFPKLRL